MKLFKLFSGIIFTFFLTGCPGNTSKEATLPDYLLKTGPVTIANTRNASGITFNHDSKTLFMIQDSPVWVHKLDLTGKTIREFDLKLLDDTEGIAYLGNNQFALLEESTARVHICTITASTKGLSYRDITTIIVTKPDGNNSLEGIAYDQKNNCLYIVKEKNPKTIFKVSLDTKKAEIPWELEKIDIDDASGICFDPRTGHLLILSHESRCIVECTVDGQELARLSLESGKNLLKKQIEKPEGITINPKDGTIYICSEKNHLYIFALKPRGKTYAIDFFGTRGAHLRY